MESIQVGPHYEIHSTELAKWLEEHAADSWWNVDGDPLLNGRLFIPCPTDEVTAELCMLDRTLLIQAPPGETEAKGQLIDASQLGPLFTRMAEDLRSSGPIPPWAHDLWFYLSWKGSPHEWILAEDTESAEQFAEEAAPKTK